ncbi:hypothetical protein F7734_37050 [Scytonema sp. UIC 10036]|uniref:hypothetical protein n=1 Tax=Scytonema sp. UIC 10036 TaxID=2304196 RepID=UPI0012DA149F|nr:hypothetical protein [Scytonema sp. UIC 10036]MUG97629.1 hypothetical protein [Scytonema sp. UIC 10036]
MVTASDLAAWASQYPAVVIKFFKPNLINCLTLEDWGDRITELTSTYVQIEAWAAVKQSILDHANFKISCKDAKMWTQIDEEYMIG